MKILESHKFALMSIGGCSVDKSENGWKKIFFSTSPLIIFSCQVSCAISTVIFIKRSISVNLDDTVYALLQVAGLTYQLYAMVVAFFMRHKISLIFSKLTEIYEKYENISSFKYLERTNARSEWMWTVYSKVAMGGFIANSIASVVFSVMQSLHTNGYVDVHKIYHVYKVVLPWNQDTFIGYLGEITYCFIVGLFYEIASGAFLLLFVSMCLHHLAFNKMFQDLIHNFDRVERRHPKVFFRDLVEYHVTVRDWFLETADTYSLLVMVRLICSMMLMACSVFQLDLELKHLSSNIVMCIMAIMISVTDLLLYCYFGKSATDSHTSMADCLYECNWIELSTEHKPVLILMIANMQRPMFYDGFGIAKLDLETFKQYIKTVYTFYMMFKTVSE